MLLDTSGLLCCFDGSDARHANASSLFTAAPRKLVHNCVLTEFVALCQARKLRRADALGFLTDLTHHLDIEVVWIDEFTHELAMALLNARLDKTYSLCDAVSFVLMRERGVTDALTTDRHFDQEGFRRLLPASV